MAQARKRRGTVIVGIIVVVAAISVAIVWFLASSTIASESPSSAVAQSARSTDISRSTSSSIREPSPTTPPTPSAQKASPTTAPTPSVQKASPTPAPSPTEEPTCTTSASSTGSLGGGFRLSDCQDGRTLANYGETVLLNDFRGTGFDDVVVTAKDQVMVYYRSAAGLSAQPDWKKTLDSQESDDGTPSVAVVKSFHNGGTALVIGDLHLENERVVARVEIYLADQNGLHTQPDWIATGFTNITSSYIYPVDAAGDLDCDGYTDIVVGLPSYKGAGAVFIYSGEKIVKAIQPGKQITINGETEADAIALGDQTDEFFGYAVAGAGKVEGPTKCDAIIVGAPFYHTSAASADDTSTSTHGKVFVYYGSDTIFTSTSATHLKPDWTKEGAQEDYDFGESVSSAGDVKHNGSAGVIVGDPGYTSTGGDWVGAVFVYYGSPAGLPAKADWQLIGTSPDGAFGDKVSGGVDLDGCGFADIVIGTPELRDENGDVDGGTISIYTGGPTGLGHDPVWQTSVKRRNELFGDGIAVGVDKNSSVVVAGAPADESGDLYLYTVLPSCSR